MRNNDHIICQANMEWEERANYSQIISTPPPSHIYVLPRKR